MKSIAILVLCVALAASTVFNVVQLRDRDAANVDVLAAHHLQFASRLGVALSSSDAASKDRVLLGAYAMSLKRVAVAFPDGQINGSIIHMRQEAEWARASLGLLRATGDKSYIEAADTYESAVKACFGK